MINSAVEKGIPKEVATKMVAQTCIGAGEMVFTEEISPEQLRKNVTSLGGCTEVGLNYLKEQKLENIFNDMLTNVN